MSTIIAEFKNGKYIITTNEWLWQYDQGQLLEIQGLILPSYFKVDFCNQGEERTKPITTSSNIISIPDEFLLKNKPVEVYVVFYNNENERETEYKIVIPIKPRPQPTDISPTPVEQQVIDELIFSLNDGVQKVEEGVDEVNQAVDSINEEVWQIEQNKQDIENLKNYLDNFLVISD